MSTNLSDNPRTCILQLLKKGVVADVDKSRAIYNTFVYIFSSQEPLGSQVSLQYRQAPLSIRRRRPSSSTLLNIFSSETAWPIKVKFHLKPLWDRGTKVCSNSPGHMTNMAATPIYGKNLKKSSSPEPKGR